MEGAVSLRGTLAENYFRGFKRAENRGTYSTPLSDAAGIEILRGPPSPIYGAGKVGGLVNFLPKSAAANDSLGGEVTVTYGSYAKRNLTAQLSTPVSLGAAAGGLHAYGEIDDSFSFYRGIHPSHQLLELSGGLALGDWSFAADYMYYHSNGDVQTPGWNRLTQALIDNGTYITGRNTSLKDADGNGRLTLNEFGGNPYFFDPNFHALACVACQDAAHKLDTGLRHHHARSAHRLSGARRGFLQHHHPHRLPGSGRMRWARARLCGCSCSAMCCRMTASFPTAFPAPIAPRFSRRGCAMTSSAISAC